MKAVSVDVFLAQNSYPLIDVRSPGEFAAGHIPGAVSIPLFDDTERAVVGTAYKQQSREEAIRVGLRIAGTKMKDYIQLADALSSKEVRLHCWRGGMRSEAMAWLFEKLGIQTIVLQGGYKAYRQALVTFFDQPLMLNILTGYTGAGKTRILLQLRELGQQVIDLEGLANHQGSSFGNEKSTGQPPTEQFQNNLFEEFRKLDLARPVWLEDESFCIGCACMPEALFHRMQESPRYLLNVHKDRRLENILQDYGTLGAGKLIAATRGIQRKLGKRNTEEAEALIEQGQLKEAAALLLTYYDKRYEKSLEKTRDKVMASMDIDGETESEIAKNLIDLAYVR